MATFVCLHRLVPKLLPTRLLSRQTAPNSILFFCVSYRFWVNHHLLDIFQRPRWRVVKGRSREYVKKVAAGKVELGWKGLFARGQAHMCRWRLEAEERSCSECLPRLAVFLAWWEGCSMEG